LLRRTPPVGFAKDTGFDGFHFIKTSVTIFRRYFFSPRVSSLMPATFQTTIGLSGEEELSVGAALADYLVDPA